MKYSVRTRVSGGEIGSHDTVWDEAQITAAGWLIVVNKRRATQAEREEAANDGANIYYVTTDCRWYPPTSVYSVRPVTD